MVMENEIIAHDLAVAWAQSAIEKRVKALTSGNSMVEEYLAAYHAALKKLHELNQTSQQEC